MSFPPRAPLITPVANPDRVFGLETCRNLLAKLDWELDQLRETNFGDIRPRIYHSYNCAVTAWHVMDWIYEGLTDEQLAAIEAHSGKSFPTLAHFQRYMMQECRWLHLCRQVATRGKHRTVTVHPDPGVQAAIIVTLVPSTTGVVTHIWNHYEPGISDGSDRYPAYWVYREASSFLKGFIDRWQIEPDKPVAPKRGRSK